MRFSGSVNLTTAVVGLLDGNPEFAFGWCARAIRMLCWGMADDGDCRTRKATDGRRLEMTATRPSTVKLPELPPQGVKTVFDFFLRRFPRIAPATWRDRFAAGKVWAAGEQIDAGTLYQPLLEVHYRREVEREPPVREDFRVVWSDQRPDGRGQAAQSSGHPWEVAGCVAASCTCFSRLRETNESRRCTGLIGSLQVWCFCHSTPQRARISHLCSNRVRWWRRHTPRCASCSEIRRPGFLRLPITSPAARRSTGARWCGGICRPMHTARSRWWPSSKVSRSCEFVRPPAASTRSGCSSPMRVCRSSATRCTAGCNPITPTMYHDAYGSTPTNSMCVPFTAPLAAMCCPPYGAHRGHRRISFGGQRAHTVSPTQRCALESA